MENFEEYLKNEAESFKIQPSEKVWKGVQAGISKPKKAFIWWYAAAVLFLISGASILYTKYKSGNYSTENKATDSSENKSAENLASIPPKDKNNAADIKVKENKPQNNSLAEPKIRPGIMANRPTQNNSKTPKEGKKTEVETATTNNTEDVSSVPYKEIISLLPLKGILINPSIQNRRESLLVIDDIQVKLKNKGKDKKIYLALNTGVTIAKPLQADYNNFVKPGMGFTFQISAGYNVSKIISLSLGLGYQQNMYKVGVVSMTPETIYLATSNGVLQEIARYRLNNESTYKNFTRQIIVPVGLHFQLPMHPGGGQLIAFAGIYFANTINTDYIIKNKVNDKLFSDEKLLNHVNNYLNIGLSYSKKTNTGLRWIVSYKFQYQIGNTFKPGFDFKEHLLVHGLNLGIIL